MRSTRCPTLFQLLLLSVTFHQTVFADAPRYLFGTPTKLPEPVNVPNADDVGNVLTPDGLQMYFSSNRGSSHYLYVASRANTHDPFGEPEKLGINSDGWSSSIPDISADGLELYFQSYRPLPDGRTPGKNQLWVATRPTKDVDFGDPIYLENLNAPFVGETVGPSLSSDGLTLYYAGASDRGSSLHDIVFSTRASSTDPWGPPQNVGAPINSSSGLEFFPRISTDGLTLFFLTFGGSNQRGDYDIQLSTRKSPADPWSKPVNLGDTVNTAQGEEWAFLDADRQTFYFTRGYDGENRKADIWQAPVLPFDRVSMPGSSGTYTQGFDELGTDSSSAGTPLPNGWTFTANDVVFNNATTRKYPPSNAGYAGVFSAGADGAADRALVTDVTRNEPGELDFRTLVTGDNLQALRLGFDIEAWQARSGLGINSGEAAFHVVLEADSGNGFQQVKDLGEFGTGKTLARPASGNLVDGNDPAYRVSIDTGPIDVDVPVGATLRTRWIGTESSRNVVFGLDNVSLRFAAPGDANIDGVFNSLDLVQVLQAAQYQDQLAGNSTWAEGDWNNDGEFDSLDLVAALQTGSYGQSAGMAALVPEPSSALLGLLALGTLVVTRRLWQ